MDPQFEDPHTLLPVGTLLNIPHTHTHTHLQVKLCPGAVGHEQLNCYGFWPGYNCILKLRTNPVPTSAPYVSDNIISTEEIWTKDPQFECQCILPTELIGKFPIATTSRSTFHQRHSILPPPPPQIKLCLGAVGHKQLIYYEFWPRYILQLWTHPVPTSAPYVSDNTISTEEIRTTDP